MKSRKIFAIALLLAGGAGIAFSFLPKHVKRAILYGQPDMDDYTLFENRRVETSEPEAWKLDKDYNTVKLSEKSMNDLEKLETSAFLVVQDGKIRYEYYGEGHSQDAVSNGFSITKSILALLVGIAMEEGDIDGLDQPAGKYIEDMANKELAQLTILQLLTMSAALDYEEDLDSPFSKSAEAYYGTDLEELVNELQLAGEPGQEFKYQNLATQLLGFILAEATGKTLAEYASEQLWGPLGATHDALWSLDRDGGTEKAFCCFHATARDFARIGQLVLDEGKVGLKRIVDKDYMETMIQPASNLADGEGEPLSYYGYHMWIMNYNGMEIPYMRGLKGQYIFVIPDKDAVAVRLGHRCVDKLTDHHQADSYYWIDAAMEALD